MEKEIICNQCGRKIERKDGILREDIFEGKKEWGYFSAKDREYHEFFLCEKCYDKFISGFKIPVKVTEVTEI